MNKFINILTKPLLFTLLLPISLCLFQTANANDKSTYLNWLQSGWGETDQEGKSDENYACSQAHNMPAALTEKAKGQGLYGKFYDGALAFVNVDGTLHVVSGYKKPMESARPDEDILTFLKRSQTAIIPVRMGTDARGYVQMELGAEIPNIPRKRIIIPLTSHRFKLAAPESTKGGFGGSRDYYFERCGG